MTQVVMYPLVAPLALRVGVTRLYNAGIATAGLSTVIFGMLYHIPGGTGFITACFVARIVEGTGTAAVSACAFTIIGNQLSERASSAVALVTAAQSAGFAIAPAIGGGLYALAGFGLPFYTIGSAMIVAALVNLYFMPAVLKKDDASEGLLRSIRVFAGSRENWLGILIVFSYHAGICGVHVDHGTICQRSSGHNASHAWPLLHRGRRFVHRRLQLPVGVASRAHHQPVPDDGALYAAGGRQPAVDSAVAAARSSTPLVAVRTRHDSPGGTVRRRLHPLLSADDGGHGTRRTAGRPAYARLYLQCFLECVLARHGSNGSASGRGAGGCLRLSGDDDGCGRGDAAGDVADRWAGRC